MESIRDCHYIFAHRLLPHLFLKNPGNFIKALKEKGVTLLSDIWNHIGENPESTAPMAEGLKLEFREAGRNTDIALVTLPEPAVMTEAYFVAMIYRDMGRRFFFFKRRYTRYITLELGFDMENPRTVLCEWDKNAHYNMGDGPRPELSAFFKKVCEII